jgi:DNA primase
VNRQVIEELKQHIPLVEYLQAHDWQPALNGGRWMGLCPLHTDHKPSFLVDPSKGLFYCYGCGRGGEVIRFAEIYHQVNFPQAITLLREWCGLAPLLNTVIDFYRIQLHRYNEALAYMDQRGVRSFEVIEHMRIGYAPGGGLRSWLTQLGYPLSLLRRAGLVNGAGYDSYIRREPDWSMALATTATSGASCSRWTAISMAAVFAAHRHRICFCRDRKVVCTYGNTCGDTRT